MIRISAEQRTGERERLLRCRSSFSLCLRMYCRDRQKRSGAIASFPDIGCTGLVADLLKDRKAAAQMFERRFGQLQVPVRFAESTQRQSRAAQQLQVLEIAWQGPLAILEAARVTLP